MNLNITKRETIICVLKLELYYNIKTQINSTGTAKVGQFDYSIITDAINAAMATIGGVLMQGGLINGYNIAKVAADAAAAKQTANSAYSTANSAMKRADAAYDHLPQHSHTIKRVSTKISYQAGDSSVTVYSSPVATESKGS